MYEGKGYVDKINTLDPTTVFVETFFVSWFMPGQTWSSFATLKIWTSSRDIVDG